ncbi:hypothetical protein [Virgibacillus halodenitrificans]|uniref:Lipoprotein n=1 Tax=Virgibacillus halodenitrificans TaxID=1482 RepID=A0ABR7VIT1_VIRHA|nr:hypothetical protein [Virgibacillus halodenitrificans]MBD1221845.1 hypothetical protein [Virgibacillus halodenitrificans]
MKYWLVIFLMFFVLLLGGCKEDKKQRVKPSEMNVKDLPDMRAFQDEFTRELLQSTEETREGYYLFMSGTGAYKMDFPAGGIVGEKGYGKVKERKEGYGIGILSKYGLKSSIDVNFDSNKESSNLNSYIDNLKQRLQKKVEFKEIKTQKDQQTFYYSSFERNDLQTYAGYVQNNASSGGIQVVYQIDCKATTQLCDENKQENLDQFINWLKSIEFVNENRSD